MQKRFETADSHCITNKHYEGRHLKNLVNTQVLLLLFDLLFLRQAKYISNEASLITSQE